MGNPSNKFTPEKVEQILGLYYQDKLSPAKIAKLVGCSPQSVLNWVERTGGTSRSYQESRELTASALEKQSDQFQRKVQTCLACKIEKPWAAFGSSPQNRLGIRGTCKECVNKRKRDKYPQEQEKLTKRMRDRRKSDPVRFRGYDMKKRFGITLEEFDKRFVEQGNKCAGCGATESGEPSGSWHIDHDHACCSLPKRKTCGKCVRGILCRSCNLSLGNAQDNIERLRGLANYLEAYQKGPGEKGYAAPMAE